MTVPELLDVNESAEEEAELEESASESEATEDEAEPDAETGDTAAESSSDETEDPDEPAIGPVPYDRFREVNEKAKTAAQEAEYYKQLLEDPDIAAAVQSAYAQKQGQPVDDTRYLAPGEVLLPERDVDEFVDDLDYIRYNNERAQQQQRINQAKYQVLDQQKQAAAAQQEAQTEFLTTLTQLTKAEKMVLSEEDQTAVVEMAEVLELGLLQKRRPISYSALAKQAYALVKPQLEANKTKAKLAAEAARGATVRTQKARIAAGQVGPVGGASVGADVEYANPREAMEAAYRLAYGE